METEKEDRDIATRRALRFARYQPRTRKEVERRMRRYGYQRALIELVLSELEGAGLIDDRRYAKSFIEEKVNYGDWSARAVRERLIRKGVPDDLIKEMLEEYPWDKELERAVDVAAGRMKKYDLDDDLKARKKIVGHLMRRGFSRETAESACRRVQERKP